MATPPFPRMMRVRQSFTAPPATGIRAALQNEFAKVRSRIQPGARIAVGVGSRGIANLASIVTGLLACLKASGAKPFIVPAMGSHGGATPEGQSQILTDYGITAERLQVPVHTAMEVERIGVTEQGVDVFISREAWNADGIVVVNRIKPHTDFASDALGSGLLKMLAVGLGKHPGACAYHAAAPRFGYEPMTRSLARAVLRTARVLFGVGVVENQIHKTFRLAIVPAEDFEARDAELFAEAKRLMPRLPLDDIDLLIVDRIGKNISGTGMDTSLIGREVHGYSAKLETCSQRKPYVRRIFVRDLTPETHGNGNGIGLADFTTTRLVRAFDFRKTYTNVLTALSLNGSKIPVHFETDQEVMASALATLALPDIRQAKVVRIRDTQSLEYLEVSEACAELIRHLPELETLSAPADVQFGPDNNLLPLVVPEP